MMLKAKEIETRLAATPRPQDPLVIVPRPIQQDKGAASIDLRLGTWFVTMRQLRFLAHRDRPFWSIVTAHSGAS